MSMGYWVKRGSFVLGCAALGMGKNPSPGDAAIQGRSPRTQHAIASEWLGHPCLMSPRNGAACVGGGGVMVFGLGGQVRDSPRPVLTPLAGPGDGGFGPRRVANGLHAVDTTPRPGSSDVGTKAPNELRLASPCARLI